MADFRTTDWPHELQSDEEAIFRLQSILLANAEGARDETLDREYRELRNAFVESVEYNDVVPRLVRLHRDLGGLWPYMKSVSPQWEPRRQHVREEMQPLFNRAEEIGDRLVSADPPWPSRAQTIDASDWTGMQSPSQRLAAARALLPVARASIERLIEHLEQPNHNGAPPLDDTTEALDNLRSLHRTLGQILEALEEGSWNEALGQGLPQEAARYLKRAARALRDDPMPYAMSALLISVLSACGFPNLAGWLGGVAIAVRKSKA